MRFQTEVIQDGRDAVEQRLVFETISPQKEEEIVLRGAVTASEEGFPVEMMSAAQ